MPVLLLTLAVSGGGPSAAAPRAAPGGPYRPPVAPVSVVAAFDPPTERWLAGHRGVDLAAAPGTEVVAAGSGVVVFAGRVADRGVVSVDHGTIRTTYEPVDATVAAGDAVALGAVLGTVGSGAHCSQRCVHWGARIGDEYVDPLALITDYRPVLKTPLP
jgi:murein DD-endopeptidase MepM/ murein hydrolase activator NlpD